jgi:transposase
VRTALRQQVQRERKKRPSKLDPFKPLIHKLVLTDGLSSVRVLEEIRAVGYAGGDCILKGYVRTFRPTSTRRPHLRFETSPGVQGQVDLSPYTVLLSGEATPVVCFSLVLGYSRWHFIRFVLHADVHTLCHCHVLGFEDAGGVPHEILYDRMKQVVVHSHKDGVIFHELFEKMAQHYGFRAVALAPGYKEGKGKVENPFKYVEGNFLAGRTFVDLDDLNRQAQKWLVEIARVRVHRTTREQPQARLTEEQPSLIPLPARRFEAGVVVPRLVGADFCVQWDTNRYSVPPRFASKSALVRVLDGRIEILIDGAVVAAHAVLETKYQRTIAPEHEAEFRATCTSRHVLKEQFQRLGAIAEPFAAGLVELHGGSAGYHMGQILKLADRVGVARVAEALRRAARYGAFDHNAVARIVAGKPAKASGGAPEGRAGSATQLDKYLKGAGVHQRSPDGYKKLVGKESPPREDPTDDEKKKEDEGDGQ